jgi:hypothetical protein
MDGLWPLRYGFRKQKHTSGPKVPDLSRRIGLAFSADFVGLLLQPNPPPGFAAFVRADVIK